ISSTVLTAVVPSLVSRACRGAGGGRRSPADVPNRLARPGRPRPAGHPSPRRARVVGGGNVLGLDPPGRPRVGRVVADQPQRQEATLLGGEADVRGRRVHHTKPEHAAGDRHLVVLAHRPTSSRLSSKKGSCSAAGARWAPFAGRRYCARAPAVAACTWGRRGLSRGAHHAFLSRSSADFATPTLPCSRGASSAAPTRSTSATRSAPSRSTCFANSSAMLRKAGLAVPGREAVSVVGLVGDPVGLVRRPSRTPSARPPH